MSDPVAIARLMLREPGLSGRLALAIDHLEEEWKSLPLTVRFPNGVDEEYKALRKEVIELADPGNLELDQINQKLGEWLRGKAPHADPRVLLAYVTAVDLAIEPFLDAPQILRFLSSDWSTGQGHHDHRIRIWTRSRLLRNLHDEIERKRHDHQHITPLERYEPRLIDHLSAIGFASQLKNGRQLKFEGELPAYVENRFAERFMVDGGHVQDVRVGLFSLRGGLTTSFGYTRKIAEKTHGFRSQSVQPTSIYRERLRKIIEAASNERLGVDLLVLPELSVDGEGLDLIASELQRAAAHAGQKPPLLTFAGSFHLA